MSTQQMQHVFDLRMEPIQTHDEYPRYARSETKPVIRARHIIDQGAISATPCSICVGLGQDCYRWENTFSKCAYCTSKDKKREFCHLPGQEAAQAPERRKRRRITRNVYAPGGEAASTADTMMSGTLVSGTVSGTLTSGTTPFSGTPLSGVPVSGSRSARERAPSPDLDHTTMRKIHPRVPPPPPQAASAAAGSEALERITALENQVSSLGAKVMEMLVRLDEVSSCVSTGSTPRRHAAVGVSPTTSNITFEDLQAQLLRDAPSPLPPPADVAAAVHLATREWVERPITPEIPDASPSMQISTQGRVKGPEEERKTPSMPEHTVEHPEGYRPVNCSCAASETGVVMPRIEVNAFPADEIEGRGNLF